MKGEMGTEREGGKQGRIFSEVKGIKMSNLREFLIYSTENTKVKLICTKRE